MNLSFIVMICFQEVEVKYNQLRQTLNDTATDSDDNNGVLSFHFPQLLVWKDDFVQGEFTELSLIPQITFSDDTRSTLSWFYQLSADFPLNEHSATNFGDTQ